MILYSFRRCPWAMRARLALRYAGCALEIVEVAMKNKPAALLALSPKGTVPVLDTGAVPLGDKASNSAGLFFIATSRTSTAQPA